MLNRRRFLQNSSLVSLAPFLPSFLPDSLRATEAKADGRILVVIQLDGGNDGLNTVIPIQDEAYARARPTLRIEEKEVLKLTDSVGLNPGMKAAADLFENGRLAIIQGVGYPNPNRSHFESMSIWQHARLETSQHDSVGWLGRTCDGNRRDLGTPDSIFLGRDAIPVALRGRRAQSISMDSEIDLQLLSSFAPLKPGPTNVTDVSAFVERTLDESYLAARRFQETVPTAKLSSVTYPGSRLASHLQLISRLIKVGGETRIFYTLQSGYDTHATQLFTHRQLLSEFSNALQAFLDDLKESGLGDRVVVLAFSEFGRRVQENDSAGTDHGAAGPVFLAGSRIQRGILGANPSLTNLDDGDLTMQFDFRQIYATLLERWLSVDSKPVLIGEFSTLPLFV